MVVGAQSSVRSWRERPVPCRSSTGDSSSPQHPEWFSIHHLYLAPFFPHGFPDLALPSQKGRNRKLGDIYLISSLGYRRCPCCLPFDHRPRGWRNFLAGKRQAKSQHVCRETFAVGARWARGIKEMGIAPHRWRMNLLDSKSLHWDSQGGSPCITQEASLSQHHLWGKGIFLAHI